MDESSLQTSMERTHTTGCRSRETENIKSLKSAFEFTRYFAVGADVYVFCKEMVF